VQAEALGPVRGTAIEALATISLEEGDPARALRLLGASAGLRERGGGRPPAWLRRRAGAVREEAERLLSAEDGQRAWAQGAAMSTEEAIAYAVQSEAFRDLEVSGN
jgi:hypothetical protein